MGSLERLRLWTEVLSEEPPASVAAVDGHGIVGQWAEELRFLDARSSPSSVDRTGLQLEAAATLPSGELVVATAADLRVWVDGVLAESALTQAVGAPVTQLASTPEQLWLSTGDQLHRFDARGLTEVLVAGGRFTGAFALGPPDRGRIWVATSGGLVALDAESLRVLETQPDIRASSIAADCTGQVWAVDGDLLWERHSAGDWTPWEPTIPVKAVQANPAGEGVWIATTGPVLHATADDLRSTSRARASATAVDALGRLLVPDESGLLRYSTAPAVAVAGLADGAAIASTRTLLLAPSLVGELVELRAEVDGIEVEVNPTSGEALLDPTPLATDELHTFQASARWADGSSADALPLRFTIDRAGSVSWVDDIEPIYFDHCAICHDGSAETQLDTPEAWRTRIDTLIDLVSQGSMPIGSDPLTDEQVSTIEAWREADFP